MDCLTTSPPCQDFAARGNARQDAMADALELAHNIATLAQWVERARFLSAEIAVLAEDNLALADIFRAYDIRCRAAAWETHQSDALDALCSLQARLIADAMGGVH